MIVCFSGLLVLKRKINWSLEIYFFFEWTFLTLPGFELAFGIAVVPFISSDNVNIWLAFASETT